jgi:hypothetical protein
VALSRDTEERSHERVASKEISQKDREAAPAAARTG